MLVSTGPANVVAMGQHQLRRARGEAVFLLAQLDLLLHDYSGAKPIAFALTQTVGGLALYFRGHVLDCSAATDYLPEQLIPIYNKDILALAELGTNNFENALAEQAVSTMMERIASLVIAQRDECAALRRRVSELESITKGRLAK